MLEAPAVSEIPTQDSVFAPLDNPLTQALAEKPAPDYNEITAQQLLVDTFRWMISGNLAQEAREMHMRQLYDEALLVGVSLLELRSLHAYAAHRYKMSQ